MAEYAYVGTYANTVYADDKSVPVGPGDRVELSDDDLKVPDNMVLVDEGMLVDVAAAEKEAKAAETATAKADKEVKK